MKKAQEKIKQFDLSRGWENSWNIKDLLLNINEEIGEFWNLIKWIDTEQQKKVIKENKKEAENFIGDLLWIVFKLANQIDVNAEKEFDKVLNEYEKRMPAEKMKKVKHANKLVGGIDNKE